MSLEFTPGAEVSIAQLGQLERWAEEASDPLGCMMTVLDMISMGSDDIGLVQMESMVCTEM